MRLSVCLAVYNEEKNIHHALDSVCAFADEIIVVDGGSTDKTVDKARSYGPKVKIIETDNPPMFHINKQKAIAAATGDWVLQLDADEEVSPELKKEILDTLGKGTPVAYQIPRRNWFLTRFLSKGGQYPDYTLRLYKKGFARFPCKDIHENVTVTGETGTLLAPLLHYADPTFARYLARFNRYTTLEAGRLREAKERPGLFSYFLVKPIGTFLSMFLRHRGYVDGFPGFVFALFSSIRFWAIYVKWHEQRS